MAKTASADNLLPEPASWMPVNDGVMGGLSQSAYRGQTGYAGVFSGQVSLENNGGFASARAPLHFDTAHPDGELCLKVFGDGNRYSLRFRTNRSLDGIAYAATFQANEEKLSEHRFTASDFTAVWRGRVISDAPPLRWEDVSQIGLMISDKQAGPFLLYLIALNWVIEPE